MILSPYYFLNFFSLLFFSFTMPLMRGLKDRRDIPVENHSRVTYLDDVITQYPSRV